MASPNVKKLLCKPWFHVKETIRNNPSWTLYTADKESRMVATIIFYLGHYRYHYYPENLRTKVLVPNWKDGSTGNLDEAQKIILQDLNAQIIDERLANFL